MYRYFLEENNKCPLCKLTFEYKINNKLKNELNNLSFECLFFKMKDEMKYYFIQIIQIMLIIANIII